MPELSDSFVVVGDDKFSDSELAQLAQPLAPTYKPSSGVPLTFPHPSLLDSYEPGSSKSYAHNWSTSSTGGYVKIAGKHFVDAYGRVCGLRGVNLSGSCKSPAADPRIVFPGGAESVTFVGRPFPLEEAPEHFSRLRRWGLTFIRFLVTWEAIEHAGPGIYDFEYLTYLQQLLSLLPQYGLHAFVSLHQDVWSRYTGGSGAPLWTLTLVGLDVHTLEETGAAWLKGVQGGGHIKEERGLWPCGYQKMAAATMNTAFWAGDVFMPKTMVTDPRSNGSKVNIQTFLQDKFLDMWEQLAKVVGSLEGVLGFEIMNEPHRGYVELQSLHEFDYNTDLHLGHVPSALQSFALASGHTLEVPHYTRSFPLPTRHTSSQQLNPDKKSAWLKDGPTEGQCIWESHGVWGWDKAKKKPVVLRENYFKRHPMTDAKIDWYMDFYYPLLKRWAERVQKVSSADKLIFVEAIPNEFCPESWTPEHRPSNMVYAPHWYDLNALFKKAFGNFSVNVQELSRGAFPLKTFHWGHKGVRDNFSKQIGSIVQYAERSLGDVPVLVGECGIPMDMNLGEAFRTNNWSWQAKMMDAMITGLERSLVGFTLWNYNSENDDRLGDHWNGENFSWISSSRTAESVKRSLQPNGVDQISSDLDKGGRILRAIARPYAAKTAGIPKKMSYELNTGRFEFEWESLDQVSQTNPSLLQDFGGSGLLSVETEIYYPSFLVHGRKLVVSGLKSSDQYRYDEARQTLFIVTKENSQGNRQHVVVTLDPPLEQMFELNDFWSDFKGLIMALLGIVLGIVFYYLQS